MEEEEKKEEVVFHYELVGTINLFDVVPEFVIPVFKNEHSYFIQNRSNTVNIDAFDIITVPNMLKIIKPLNKGDLIIPSNKFDYVEGDEVVLGYQVDESKIFIGTLAEFEQYIKENPIKDEFMSKEVPHVIEELKYKKVDLYEYVNECLQNGTVKPFYAAKYGCVRAREGVVGETVTSWSCDEQGNEIEEKVNEVKIDEETNRPQYVLTKTDNEGNAIVDENGHLNQWIANAKTLTNKYDVDKADSTLFRPKRVPQMFVRIPENIIFKQWNSNTKLAKGGYINITNPRDMYGISQRDFNDTYKPMEEMENEMKMK